MKNMKKKILIVDDEGMIRELVQCILEKAGYECRTSQNGKEALDIIAGGFDPDLVITDVIMPILDGVGLAHQLRNKNMDVPILFVSGDLGSHNLGDLQEFSSHLLPKPFVPVTLTHMVGYVLSVQPQQVKPAETHDKVQTVPV